MLSHEGGSIGSHWGCECGARWESENAGTDGWDQAAYDEAYELREQLEATP